MKEINARFNFYPARNAEHYQAHSDLLAAIPADFTATLGIAHLREEYARLFDIENECYLRNAAYQDTPEVEAKDRRRDDRFIYVSQRITTGRLSPVPEEAEAALRLDYLLAPYRDAPRLNYASNTAAVADFVLKMREPAHAADVATLGLTAAIDALYQVNELVTRNAAQGTQIGAVIDRANAILVQLQSTLSRAGVAAKSGLTPDAKPGSGGTGGGSETPGGGGNTGGGDGGNQDDDILS